MTEQDVKFSDFIRGLPAATEADLKSGNYFALDGADGTKRLQAEVMARASDIISILNTIGEKVEATIEWSDPGHYIARNSGYDTYVSSSTHSRITNFIPVRYGQTVVTNVGANPSNQGYAFYSTNSNTAVVSYGAGSPNGVEVPENAKFVRFSSDDRLKAINDVVCSLENVSAETLNNRINSKLKSSIYEDNIGIWKRKSLVFTDNSYIGYNSGGITTGSSWARFQATNYIEVSPGSIIRTNGCAKLAAFNAGYAFYDSTNHYIFGERIVPNGLIVPENAAKLRFTIDRTLLDGQFVYFEECKQTNSFFAKNPGKVIVCIGDSVTYGIGGDKSVGWVNYLDGKLKKDGLIFEAKNYGSPGNTSEGIAAISGAEIVSVSSFIIPASGSVVISPNKVLQCGLTICVGCEESYICGVRGKITYTDGNYYFTRYEDGVAVNVEDGEIIYTNAAKDVINADCVTIMIGANDRPIDNTKADLIISRAKKIASMSKNGKYIVLGHYTNFATDYLIAKYKETFSTKFVDVYSYFAKYGVKDAVNQGLLPEGSDPQNWFSLLVASDGVHPNDTGHKVLAGYIFSIYNQLGY